jgi:hypothetical protein
MPFEKGNKAALGNRGGGRRSKKDEELRELMVQKAIGKYVKALRSLEDLTDKQIERISKLVMPVVVKNMPSIMANDAKNPLIQISKEIAEKNELTQSTEGDS